MWSVPSNSRPKVGDAAATQVRLGTAPASSKITSGRLSETSERSDGNARHNEENVVAKGKRTFQPNNRRRARVHGFRLRMRTRAGRAIVSGRRRKGRRALSA